MVTALILDADGVLINGESFADALHRNYDVDLAKEKEFFKGPFQDCLVGKADLRTSVAPYLPSFGFTGSVDEFLAFWFTSEHAIDETLVAYVQRLRSKGVRVVLATNQEKYRTDYMLKHMGFAGAFDGIYSSAHMGLKKPDAEFFAKVVDDLGVPKERVLFWDDDRQNIDGAQAYGIAAEFYKGYDGFLQKMQGTYGLHV